jgi:hypothetical protein
LSEGNFDSSCKDSKRLSNFSDMLGGPERLFVESKFASPAQSPFTEQTARMPSSVVLQRVSSVVFNLMDRQQENNSTTSESRTQEDNKRPDGLGTVSTCPEVNLASVKSAEMIEPSNPPPTEQALVSTGVNENDEKFSAANTVDDEEKPRATSGGAFSHRRNPIHDSSSDTTDEEGTRPQHLEAANTYRRDMDFEVTLLRHRNKRVLMSRLQEVSPRGRLSLVRNRSLKYDFCGKIRCLMFP